jgi:hypothetical protein
VNALARVAPNGKEVAPLPPVYGAIRLLRIAQLCFISCVAHGLRQQLVGRDASRKQSRRGPAWGLVFVVADLARGSARASDRNSSRLMPRLPLLPLLPAALAGRAHWTRAPAQRVFSQPIFAVSREAAVVFEERAAAEASQLIERRWPNVLIHHVDEKTRCAGRVVINEVVQSVSRSLNGNPTSGNLGMGGRRILPIRI